MEKTDVQGIIIKSIDYKERDKLLTLLTFEKGRIIVQAKSCNSIKSKLNSATMLKTFGTFELAVSNGRYVLSGCDVIDNFYEVSCDISKFYASEIVLEIADKMTFENDKDEKFLLKIIHTLNEIAYKSNDINLTLLGFLIGVIDDNGYMFSFDKKCVSCGAKLKNFYFDTAKTGFICPSCIEKNINYLTLSEKATNVFYTVSQNETYNEVLCPKDSIECLRFLEKLFYIHYGLKTASLEEYIQIINQTLVNKV